jgi:HK97 family phage prohead protease
MSNLNNNVVYKNFNMTSLEVGSGANANTGYFNGYASTFDLDRTNDIIVKGAFQKSIAERKNDNRRIAIHWQHDTKEVLGSISPNNIIETEKGLSIINDGAELDLNVQRAFEIYSLLKNKHIDRMSIGFSIGKSSWRKDGVREIKEIDLYEISIVSEPANLGARVTEVKAAEPNENSSITEAENEPKATEAENKIETKAVQIIDVDTIKSCATIREFERLLKDSGLFSNTAAKILAKNFEPSQWDAAENQREVDGDNNNGDINKEELKSLLKNIKLLSEQLNRG